MLVPDGVAYLMLYGKHGRAGIYMMQELFRILGLQQLWIASYCDLVHPDAV